MNSLAHAAENFSLEVAELRARLAEAEDTLAAIRRGDVDALIVGNDIYTLDSANAASNRLRKDVLTQMEDAVIALDTHGHVIFLNPAAERQYRHAASDALGRSKHELYQELWPDDEEPARMLRELETSGFCRAQSIHVLGDGHAAHVESTISRLRDAAGGDIGTLAVIRDVTARVHSEEALRDTDRRKDEFLATLAHELRNPLAPIRNALEIMRLTQDVKQQENARGIINRQIRQMVHLVDDLLDISRISQGKIELRLQNVDVNQAIQAAIETSRPLIDAGKHELSLRLPGHGALMVNADLTRLSQIVANLLNNSAKYTPQGGRIEVSVERDGSHARISVRDSGVGIPPQLLPRVFDMFAQVDRSQERSQGGLGIGLALVQRLVEMHQGSVKAHSEGRGFGSTFVVCIPLARSQIAEPAAAATDVIPNPAGAQARVLVVDDNIDSAESMSQVLTMLGYQARVAHDGVEAARAADEYRPRALVLDIGLPGMTGHEVAQHIRRQPWGRDVLLIALSGWGQDDDRRKSREAGFDHHFVKPPDIKALTDALSIIRSS